MQQDYYQCHCGVEVRSQDYDKHLARCPHVGVAKPPRSGSSPQSGDLTPEQQAYLAKYGRVPHYSEKGFRQRMQRRFFDSAEYNMRLAGVDDGMAVGTPVEPTTALLNQMAHHTTTEEQVAFEAKYGRLPNGNTVPRRAQARTYFDSADFALESTQHRRRKSNSTLALVNEKTLSQEEREFVLKYGRLPSRTAGVQHSDRRYWDSADYSLQLAGRAPPTQRIDTLPYATPMQLNEKMLTGEEREFLRKYGRLPNPAEHSRTVPRKYFDSADYYLHMAGVYPSVSVAGGRPILSPTALPCGYVHPHL